MTAKELFRIVEDRGLTLVMKDGVPVIRGDRSQVTQPLLDALKRYRLAVIAMIESRERRRRAAQAAQEAESQCEAFSQETL